MAKRFYAKTMNQDSKMIKDDWSQPCLLPKEVMDKQWEQVGNYMNHSEADLYMGVQKQMKQDRADFQKAFKPGKY